MAANHSGINQPNQRFSTLWLIADTFYSIPMKEPVTRVTVGRKPGNNIVLSNSDVSGDHAVFTLKVAQISLWEVQDLGSRNGTFVDGQRILRK